MHIFPRKRTENVQAESIDVFAVIVVSTRFEDQGFARSFHGSRKEKVVLDTWSYTYIYERLISCLVRTTND